MGGEGGGGRLRVGLPPSVRFASFSGKSQCDFCPLEAPVNGGG